MDWLQKRTPEQNKAFIQEISSVFAKAGGPISLALDSAVQRWDIPSVVEFRFDYLDEQLSLEDLRSARSIQALLSKQEVDWMGYGVDTELVAMNAFMKAERRCLETNEKLGSHRPQKDVSVVSYYAVRKIREILGEVPSLEDLPFAYGPGATTNVKSAVAGHRAKLSASPVCSEAMLPFVGEFLAEFPSLTAHHCTADSLFLPSGSDDEYYSYVSVLVGNGKLTFVPKSVKTKRPIVIEPILNGLAQKGIGTYIKDRLLRTCAVDLRDQQRNRQQAYKGSIDGSIATVDLSSASDTVSISAILELLPPDWSDFLSRYRTGRVDFGIQSIELQKWSSMGNGYTFELESVVFYALAWACTRYLGSDTREVSVFGDDIIIPSECHTLLTEVLDFYGFWVNEEKSFSSGPFRESCGADWYRGFDVRPFYLKDMINDQSLFSFHNWAMRAGERELAACIHEWTFPPNRIYGPNGYGDGHLIGTWHSRSNRESRRRGYEGGFFDTYTLNPKRHKKRYKGDWLHPAYSVYIRSGADTPTDPFIVRGSAGYAKTSIYTLATSVFGCELRLS